MLSDPQFQARESIIAVPHPRWPNLMMQNVFPKLSATPGAVRRIAPQSPGQDNIDIYQGELGLSADEMEGLRDRGVV
jgi:formyl-CoA transferase